MIEKSPYFDEMHGVGDGPRLPYHPYCDWFEHEDVRHLKRKSA